MPADATLFRVIVNYRIKIDAFGHTKESLTLPHADMNM